MIKKYIWNILISIDQLFNTLFGGDPDETISSRLGKKLRAGDPSDLEEDMCDVLDSIDPDHCAKSIEDDEGDRKVID